MKFIEVTEDFSDFKKISGQVVLIANTPKTAVRIASSDNENRWEIVKKFFPIGELMNENTHVFDGSLFANSNGQSRFFIAALPVLACEKFAEIGVKLTGSIHRVVRLDTVEHVFFKKYCASDYSFIFFPQDNGIRVLHIAENLPNAAFFISNNPAHREDELLRFFESLGETAKNSLLINCEHENYCWLENFLRKNGVPIAHSPCPSPA
jgi:hypothetical protein